MGTAADPVVVWQLEDGARRSERVVIIVDHLLGHGAHGRGVDGVDASEELLERHVAPVAAVQQQ